MFKARRTDVISNIAKALPMDRIIFEGTSATKLMSLRPDRYSQSVRVVRDHSFVRHSARSYASSERV